jgi:uncharacterized protein (DUF1330 family)
MKAKAYWVAHVHVHQPETYARYAAEATAAFALYGGRVLARGGSVVALEGRSFPRNVIVEFDDMDVAVACYHSPEYQNAKFHRDGAADIDLILLDGAPPP